MSHVGVPEPAPYVQLQLPKNLRRSDRWQVLRTTATKSQVPLGRHRMRPVRDLHKPPMKEQTFWKPWAGQFSQLHSLPIIAKRF